MNKYTHYNRDQLDELFSNYLISSWSYSKAALFSRNEKEFEKKEIYGESYKKSSSTIAGSAYHKALEFFFNNRKNNGPEVTIIDMESVAFEYIDNTPANSWKLQKTTPTIEECKLSASEMTTSLIHNFMSECHVYLEEIDEVIGVEMRCEEWLVINGVDIPLPCHANIDLVLRLKNGKIVIVDHKSKRVFTDDKEFSFTGGKQAITYIKSYESLTGNQVDEFWYIENKIAENKDNSPQLKLHKIICDKDTRTLYEAMLYEPLRRMIEAVSNPDYIYLINDMDTISDKAELYDFWAKTMIAEVEDFNIPDDKKELISKRQKKIRDATLASLNPNTISKFKANAQTFITYDFTNKDMTNAEKIEHTLRTFGIITNVTHDIKGYSSNTFLLKVSAGVKIANILNYKLDIANALNVSSIRIGRDLIVYDGKSYLSIEAPKKRDKDLLFDAKYLNSENLPIGVDNFGRTVIWNMNNPATPHVLICGATGSGKSVSIISTIEYAKLSGVKDIVIFDPKYEFVKYKSASIRVYNEIKDIEHQMKKLVGKMQARAAAGINKKILIVFDEFADAVAASRTGKELDIRKDVQEGFYRDGSPKIKSIVIGRDKSLEENLKMILQKGRSLGFRVIAATQRASTKVITGDAKVNFPVQICFRVPKEIDSKVVLDESGAETLGGKGDGLMKSPEYLDIVRFQGFYKA